MIKTHLPQINIKTIPHKKQRYNTAGDYYKKDGKWEFRVSQLSDPDYMFLIAIHEFTEWYLTQKNGIKEKDITAFDIQFEKNRVKGNTDEPGDDKNAPYYQEHQFATQVEKMIASKLGVTWSRYSLECNGLEYD